MRIIRMSLWVNSIAQIINKPIVFSVLIALSFLVPYQGSVKSQAISPQLIGSNVWINLNYGSI
jgi:hypothetical protein